jgi:hypothetical protein
MRVVDLHAVDAEVVFLRYRVLGVNERQRDEWPTVFLPGCQHRQLVQSRGTIDHLSDRRSRDVFFVPSFSKIERDRTMFPEFTKLRRQDRLGDLNQLAHKRFRLWAKREIDAALRAEHVRDDRITAALHALEQQRRPTFAITRRWISASSRYGSTSALMVMISFSLVSRSRNVRRLACILCFFSLRLCEKSFVSI